VSDDLVIPRGPISIPLANIRALFTHCDVWRDWVGGTEGRATVADARSHIHLIQETSPEGDLVYEKDELVNLRPFIKVDLYDDSQRRGATEGPTRVALGTYRFANLIEICIEDNVPSEDEMNVANGKMQFMNRVGLLLEQALEKAQITDYLDADEIAAGLGGPLISRSWFSAPPGRVPNELVQTQGDFYGCSIVLDVGT